MYIYYPRLLFVLLELTPLIIYRYQHTLWQLDSGYFFSVTLQIDANLYRKYIVGHLYVGLNNMLNTLVPITSMNLNSL